MNNWAYDKRFEEVYKQTSFATTLKLMVDRETDVQYLIWNYSSGGGVTVLVDRDGKPLLYQGR